MCICSRLAPLLTVEVECPVVGLPVRRLLKTSREANVPVVSRTAKNQNTGRGPSKPPGASQGRAGIRTADPTFKNAYLESRVGRMIGVRANEPAENLHSEHAKGEHNHE